MPVSWEYEVRALYRACHPGWPDLPKRHFFSYPTVIVPESPRPAGRIAGYASYSMNVSDKGDLAVWLADSGVAEWARGRGLARAMLRYRVNVGREMKAKCAVGMTQPDNAPMLNILRTEGFDEIRTIPSAYPDGRDGVLFIKGL